MQISGIAAGSVYNTVSYEQNTAELQQLETKEEVQEAVQTAGASTTSATANIQELYEAQQGAAASVNITQVDTSNAQVVTQSTSSAEEEESTTTRLVFNSDGSVEQVTITTDADGNETEERVQISEPTEKTEEVQAEGSTSEVEEGNKPGKTVS